MRMTNYSREAVKDLLWEVELLKKATSFVEGISTKEFADELMNDVLKLRSYPKFCLPPDGVFFESNKINLEDGFNLPFSKFIMEFEEHSDNDQITPVIYLVKTDQSNSNLIKVEVFTKLQLDNGKLLWNKRSVSQTVEFIPSTKNLKVDFFVDTVAVRSPELISKCLEEGKAIFPAFLYIFGQFLNVLNCSNVSVEKVPGGKHKKGQAAGQLPYDSYHVLVIKTKNNKDSITGQNVDSNSRKSPREHVRRGHVRRLESGSIFIAATVVNAGSDHKVEKDYVVI